MTENRERTYIDDAVDDLYSVQGQIGAVIYLMGGYDARLDRVREDLRAFLANIRDQVTQTCAFLGDGQRMEGEKG